VVFGGDRWSWCQVVIGGKKTYPFKSDVNWKPQTTPDLVEKLYDCVQIQFLHLHGHGDYALSNANKHYFVLDQD
jgi:hypothetical protein